MASIGDDLRNSIRRRLRLGQAVDEKSIRRIATSIIVERKKYIESIDTLNQFTTVPISNLKAIYGSEFTAAVADNFDGGDLTVSAKSALEEFCYLSLIKDGFSDIDSGIVIAGFGEEDFFPCLYGMRIDGLINRILKFKIHRDVQIGVNRSASVCSFAQGEMVTRFMEGIDPQYIDYLHIAIPAMVTKLSEKIVEAHVPGTKQKKDAIKRGVVRSANKMISAFEGTARRFRVEKFVDPVMDTVEILSKEDVAEMAESMVKLTSLKRRVSPDLETVGGPIDVAIISKVDGFVWIKRKQYFDRNHNQHLGV